MRAVRQRVRVAILLRHNGCLTMLLTITNSKPPATDLGYLLHKNPSRVQSFELSFGKAHVFYPEATGAPLAEVGWETVYGSGTRGYSDCAAIRRAAGE